MKSNKTNERQKHNEQREKNRPGTPGQQDPKRHEEAPGRNPAPTGPAGDQRPKKDEDDEREVED